MVVTRQNSTQSQQQYQTHNTAVMFILAALNKILADKYLTRNINSGHSDDIFRDTKKSHNAQLRAACESALQEIQELVGVEPVRDPDTTSISSVLPEPYPESARLDADKYFLPFRLVRWCSILIICLFQNRPT